MSEDYKPNPYEDAKNQLREAQKILGFSEGDYEAGTSALIATIIYAGCMAFAITLAAMLAKNFFPARLREKRTENDK